MTRAKDWSERERRMMDRAAKVHGRRTLAASLVFGLLIWCGMETYGRLRASNLVESIRTASTAEVPAIVRQMEGYRRWVDPMLDRLVRGAPDQSRMKLHGSLALLPVDGSQLPLVEDYLLRSDAAELDLILDFLRPPPTALVDRLWAVLASASPGDASLLPAASALADFDATHPGWREMAPKVAHALVSVNPVFLGPWMDAMRPVRGRLTPILAEIYRDTRRPESERILATRILGEYASDDPILIADLLMDAEPDACSTFFPIAQRHEEKTLPIFRGELSRRATISADDKDPEAIKDQLAKRQARAAIALVRMGRAEEVTPLLSHSAEPRLRSFILNWLRPMGAEARTIAAILERSPVATGAVPAPNQSVMDAVLFHPETSKRRAMILALGTFSTEEFSAGEQEPLIEHLLDLYRDDPDSGIHGAATCTLRRWKQQRKLRDLDVLLMGKKDRGERRWFVNSQGQTFAVIEGPSDFVMGSPPTEHGRIAPNETAHRSNIPLSFAISFEEVSVKAYQSLMHGATGIDRAENDRFSPAPEGPMNQLSWYEAVAYCNVLSRREGLQECYEPNSDGRYAEGMKIRPDARRRNGYRLPTDEEWEYACRAGGGTSRHYGASVDLLGRYAWYHHNSPDHALPCGQLLPNDLGLFDMLGNVSEWVQDKGGNPVQLRSGSDVADTVSNLHPRVYRGGTVDNRPETLRSANRFWGAPSNRYTDGGFRLCRTLP